MSDRSVVITHASAADFEFHALPARPRSTAVLMASPEHFDVLYVINPHMAGNIGSVDSARACAQWSALRQVYASLGYPVHVIPGAPGLPDMVFTANQSFPYVGLDGEPLSIMSRMASPHRAPEVEFFAEWYAAAGYRVIRQVDPPVEFEGMGDARWHPGRRLLYIGHGYRTAPGALARASRLIGCPVVGLELIDPHFYHLDTALSPIDETTAVYVEEAFTSRGVALLRRLFPRLVRAPLSEAMGGFAANGHSPDGRHYIVHHTCVETAAALRELGVTVIDVDTSEFIKSGGSVYCMKMMLP